MKILSICVILKKTIASRTAGNCFVPTKETSVLGGDALVFYGQIKNPDDDSPSVKDELTAASASFNSDRL